MSAARRSTQSNGFDSRSFPKFNPMPSNTSNCRFQSSGQQSQPPPAVQAEKWLSSKLQSCSRSHNVNQELENDLGEPGLRQVCCSAHPNVAACCSARPATMLPGAESYSVRMRPYKPPPPLGGGCGPFVPLASLTRIYNTEDAGLPSMEEGGGGNSEADDTDEGKVKTPEEADAGTDPIATHSALVSSISPEARRGCCRRPGGQQTVSLQVLVHEHQKPQPQPKQQQQQLLLQQQESQDLEPVNANQAEPDKQLNKRRPLRHRLFFSKSVSRRSNNQNSADKQRRSTTQPPLPLLTPLPPSPAPLEERPQQPAQQKRPTEKNCYQRTVQQQQQQRRHSKQPVSQKLMYLRSISSPLADSKIYSPCAVDYGMQSATPSQLQQLKQQRQQRQQQQRQHHHGLQRGPFSGLMRSRDSHYTGSASSLTSDY